MHLKPTACCVAKTRMADRLASALKSVFDKKSDIGLDAVVSALERAAPTSRDRQESSKSVH